MDQRQVIKSIFGVDRALIGVIHVGGLPGTPSHDRGLPEIVETAVAEACLYMSAGFHGVLIENTHDRPYLKGAVGPEIVASLAVIGHEIRRATSAPLGVQVLAGANQAALAVALACGASFVRVEGFVFAHVADEGFIESSAASLLRYRRMIGAAGIRVFADIKKKHSAHAVTADVSLVETAKAAEFFLVDGVIVSGISTGEPTDAGEVNSVAAATSVPVLVGSGVTAENVRDYHAADALIVGSDVKRDGLWSNPLDEARTRALAGAFRASIHDSAS
jgi:membrane complex biogenesis BtpA family protein